MKWKRVVPLGELKGMISGLQSEIPSERHQHLLNLAEAALSSSTSMTLRSCNLLEELGESISEILMDFIPNTDEFSKYAAVLVLAILCRDEGCASELPDGTIESLVTLFLEMLPKSVRKMRLEFVDEHVDRLKPILEQLPLSDQTVEFENSRLSQVGTQDLATVTLRLLARSGRVPDEFGESEHKVDLSFQGSVAKKDHAFVVRKHLHKQHAWNHFLSPISHGVTVMSELSTSLNEEGGSVWSIVCWRLYQQLQLLEDVTHNNPMTAKKNKIVKRRGKVVRSNAIIEEDDTSYQVIPVLLQLVEQSGVIINSNKNIRTAKGKAAQQVYACLLCTLRVLANLTHERPQGCKIFNEANTGDKKPGENKTTNMNRLMSLLAKWFPVVIQMVNEPNAKPDTAKSSSVRKEDWDERDKEVMELTDKLVEQENSETGSSWQFDCLVLLLALAANVLEQDNVNRALAAGSTLTFKGKTLDGCELLVMMFVQAIPAQAIQKFETASKSVSPEIGKEIEFGMSMDQLVLSSYSALVIGCLIRQNVGNQRRVKELLPGHSMLTLVQILEAYLGFQEQVGILTNETMLTVTCLIRELQKLEPKKVRAAASSSVPSNRETLQKETKAERPGYHLPRQIRYLDDDSTEEDVGHSCEKKSKRVRSHLKNKGGDHTASSTTKGKRVFRKRVKTGKKQNGTNGKSYDSSIFEFTDDAF